jgi:hypothetical protein
MTQGTTGIVPIATEVDAGDPTTTLLWSALRKTSLQGLSNMPASVEFVFTQQDLDGIDFWVQAGAPDN